MTNKKKVKKFSLKKMVDAELNRWEEDGRLPVLYYRKVQGNDKAVNARFWSPHTIDDAKLKIKQWREDDILKKQGKNGTTTMPCVQI